jgi:hypothetical protein
MATIAFSYWCHATPIRIASRTVPMSDPPVRIVNEGRMLIDDVGLEVLFDRGASHSQAASYRNSSTDPVLVGSELRTLLPSKGEVITSENDFG